MWTAAQRPDAPAVLTPEGSAIPYDNWARRVAGVTRVLQDRGIRAGDRLALAAPPSAAVVALLHACWEQGAVIYPLNLREPRHRWPERAGEADCAALVLDEEDGPDAGGVPQWRVDDFRGRAEEPAADMESPDGAQWAVVLHTSGSSGAPKRAVLTRMNLTANAYVSNERIPLEPGDRWLLSLPLYHVSGIGVLWRCLLAGACVAIPEDGAPLLDAIRTAQPTHLSLVPTQLQRLLAAPSGAATLASCKAILLGGGPIPPGLLQRAVNAGLQVHITYGMTETASQIATSGILTPAELSNPGAEPLFTDEVRIDVNGEILVRGPALFAGYLEGNVLRQPVDADGWFATGDLGRIGSDGKLRVTGRKDNMFVSGGENVQPERVEAALLEIDGVREAIVVPRPDGKFGARPVAFLKTDEDMEWAPHAWRARLREVLPGYMIPAEFRPWPADLAGGEFKYARTRFMRLAAS